MKTRMLLLVLLAIPLVSCRAPVSQKLSHEGGSVCSNSHVLDYRVWLPDGYEEDDREYPLLVWFHGGGDNEYSWGREGKIGEIVHARVAAGELGPFIVLSPSYGSFSPVYRTGEKLLMDTVLPEVRETYRVNDVTVAYGHSLGGLSALIAVLRNPRAFSAAVIASPFLFDTTPWDTPEAKKAYGEKYGDRFLQQWRYQLDMEFDSREEFAEWDPFSLARASRPAKGLDLLLTVGDRDPLGIYPHVGHFRSVLEENGVAHEWYVQEGVGHGTVEDPYLMDWLNERAYGDGE